jgi:cytidylate kinase
MYRALALACVREGISFKDSPRVIPLLARFRIDLEKPDEESLRPYTVLLNGEDVTAELFTPHIDSGSSDVSTLIEVRRFMVDRQKGMAEGKPVVMEGRDISLRVLPHAQLKIYLTASLEERAKRRYKQFQEKGVNKIYTEVLEETRKRDIQDSTRAIDPLTKTSDHWELDTTGLSQEEVVQKIKNELSRRQLI